MADAPLESLFFFLHLKELATKGLVNCEENAGHTRCCGLVDLSSSLLRSFACRTEQQPNHPCSQWKEARVVCHGFDKTMMRCAGVDGETAQIMPRRRFHLHPGQTKKGEEQSRTSSADLGHAGLLRLLSMCANERHISGVLAFSCDHSFPCVKKYDERFVCPHAVFGVKQRCGTTGQDKFIFMPPPPPSSFPGTREESGTNFW